MRLSPLVLAAALPACAHARDPGVFVNPGILYAPRYHPSRTAGLGGEISSVYYGTGCCEGYGPLVQGEWLPGDDTRNGASRFALEMQGVYGPLGVDAGWAVRTSGGPLAPWATGPQVGAFFSIAQASIGARALLPIAHGEAGGRDTGDTSMVITVKIPFLVYGEKPDFDPFPKNMFRMPAGRPLEVEGSARTAALVRTRTWSV